MGDSGLGLVPIRWPVSTLANGSARLTFQLSFTSHEDIGDTVGTQG